MASKSLRTLGVWCTVKLKCFELNLVIHNFIILIIFTISVESVVTNELLVRIRLAPPLGASVGSLRRILSNHLLLLHEFSGLRGVSVPIKSEYSLYSYDWLS